MVNKYLVDYQKWDECASRFITVLSNVITDAYDIITDVCDVITVLFAFISKVFSWHPIRFQLQWKWWIEIGFRTIFQNGFKTKKGPTNGAQYGFKILTYQNQFCQGLASKIHNHFPIP